MNQRRLVTDPDDLAELNNNSFSKSSRKPVTDPNDLAELNQLKKPSLEDMFPVIEPNWTKGAGLLAMTANPLVAAGRGIAPYAANALSRIGLGTAGGTAFDIGSKENNESIPELLKRNSIVNAAIEAASPAVKYGLKGINKISHAFRPQANAENIINMTGAGQDLENVGQSAAQDINQAFNKSREHFDDRYARIFRDSPLASSSIYHKVSPIQGTQQYGTLDSLNLDINNLTDPNIREMYKGFLNKPTLNAAHEFQKELGSEVGKIKRNKVNPDLEKLNLYTKIRNAVNADSYSYLKNKSPEMAKEFKQISYDYKTKHLPFEKNTAMYNLSRGHTDNPTLAQILNPFENPGKKVNALLEQLPKEFKNKIAHLGIGEELNHVTSKAINEAIAGFGKRGLKSYITPDLKKELIKMGTKQYLGKGVQSLLGAGGGYLAGNMLGSPNLGLMLGAASAPYAASKLGPVHKRGKISKNSLLDEIMKSGFTPSARALEKYNNEK